MKFCIKCQTNKELIDFSKDKTRKDGLYPYCIECKKEYKILHPESKDGINKRNKLPENVVKKSQYDKKRWNNYAEYRIHVRDQQLLRIYGITLEEFNNLRKKQNYCCKICQTPESECKKGLHVDHNHETGKVRGLLCMECNTGLGKFKDNPKLLEMAIDYLK